MKTLNHLLVAAAAVVTLNLAVSAQAAEPLLPPRAKANQIHVVPGSSKNDPNLVTNRPNGNAKAWDQARSVRKVPASGPSIDLAHGPRPTLSPKDPRYDQVARELRQSQFQVAPLK